MTNTGPVRTGRHANTSLVVLFLSLGGLAFAVLQSLVAPALPVIGRELHASTDDIAWVLTAYLLAASVLTPILGRLGDIVGKRKVLLIVLVVLAAGTLLAALAPNLPVLIVARVLQGAAGAIFPLAIGIVRDELPRERVGVTVGMLSAIFGVGGGLGIVLAGPIVDHFSWPWLFWFPLMLIAVALVGVIFGVPESPLRTPGRLDMIGAGILSLSLAALLLAISKGSDWGWGSGRTVGLIVVGLIALVVFVLTELRTREPLIDMRLIALRGVWTTNLVGLTFGFAMYGSFLLIPTLLELPAATGYGFGKSVSTAGLFLLPSTLMMMVFGPLSGVLEKRYGPKLPLIIGAVLETAAFALPGLRAQLDLAHPGRRDPLRGRARLRLRGHVQRHHRERPGEPHRRGDQRQQHRPDDRGQHRRGRGRGRPLGRGDPAGHPDRPRVQRRLRGERGGRRPRRDRVIPAPRRRRQNIAEDLLPVGESADATGVRA